MVDQPEPDQTGPMSGLDPLMGPVRSKESSSKVTAWALAVQKVTAAPSCVHETLSVDGF